MFYHYILAYQLFRFQAYAEMFYDAMVEDADYKPNGEEFCDQAWVKGCIAEIDDDEQSHSDNREDKSNPQLSQQYTFFLSIGIHFMQPHYIQSSKFNKPASKTCFQQFSNPNF